MLLNVEAARDSVRAAGSVAVLTGAGVSAESGIPTFRSNGGFWLNQRVEDIATPEGFARNPKFVWEWYEERRRGIAAAKPNAGHFALAQLENAKRRFTLITQNVDDLHERAGSKNVIHLHGSIWAIRCTVCGMEKADHSKLDHLPPVCQCGGMQRPGVVWFGEMLPEGFIERATEAVLLADVLIVAGTSAQVYPAAGLIPLAIRQGNQVIEVNPDVTEFSEEATWSLRGTAADILPQFL
jgi:NAD-dependent deacetylase